MGGAKEVVRCFKSVARGILIGRLWGTLLTCGEALVSKSAKREKKRETFQAKGVSSGRELRWGGGEQESPGEQN